MSDCGGVDAERLAELMLTAPNEMISLQCDELNLDGSIPSATERGPRGRAGAVGGRAADNGAACRDDRHHLGWHTVTKSTTPLASMDVTGVQAYS
jgi:hypothetical protein